MKQIDKINRYIKGLESSGLIDGAAQSKLFSHGAEIIGGDNPRVCSNYRAESCGATNEAQKSCETVKNNRCTNYYETACAKSDNRNCRNFSKPPE